MTPTADSYIPTHPNLAEVQFVPGQYRSYLKSLSVRGLSLRPRGSSFFSSPRGVFLFFFLKIQAFEEGDLISPLTGLTKSVQAYTSIQCGRDDHAELNSDFVYGSYDLRSSVIGVLIVLISANHSCEPTMLVDFSSDDVTKWHARAIKKINAGDPCV
jgi:hypothetical protein